MNKTESQSKFLIELNGGHWHNNLGVLGGIFVCSKCIDEGQVKSTSNNPDLFKWENMPKLREIMRNQKVHWEVAETYEGTTIRIWFKEFYEIHNGKNTDIPSILLDMVSRALGWTEAKP